MKINWAAGDQLNASDINLNSKEARDGVFTLFNNFGTGTIYGENPTKGGFSDASTPVISLGGWFDSSPGNSLTYRVLLSDFGTAQQRPFVTATTQRSALEFNTSVLYIGTDEWAQNSGGPTTYKNGSAVTVSGTHYTGALGHDPTLSYLLVLSSTTTVRRYSGIAGTTITLVDTITLDTAVDTTWGFIFDNTNSQYICKENAGNTLRRFNSTGITVDTQAFPASSAAIVRGQQLAFINNRVYLVDSDVFDIDDGASTNHNQAMYATFIPTAMTRTGY